MSAASAATRADGVPSISPILNVPRLPRSTTPGAVTSAPKLTHAWTTRPGPAAALSAGDGRPFCSEATNASPASRPASSAATVAVWCCLHATRTGKSIRAGRSSGPIAAGRAVNCSTGPSMRSPSALIAFTTAGSASQTSTSSPSRTSPAATVPPIAPPPITKYLMCHLMCRTLQPGQSEHSGGEHPSRVQGRRLQCWAKVCANLCPTLSQRPPCRCDLLLWGLLVRHRPALTMALSVGCAIVALAGCGSGGGTSSAGGSASSTTSSASAGAPVKGGDLVFANPQDANSLDEANVFDNNSIWIIEQITQPLFIVTANGKGVQPLLASSYTISKDGKTYTIKLRQGVKFSTGAPMTSADVKFTLEQTMAASAGWGYIDAAIKSVDAPDPDTVVLHLKYAWAPMLADLALFANGVVPNNYGGKSHDAFYQAPVGTGPFKWDYWHKGSALKLVKNTDYWEPGKPYLDSVTWTYVP